MPLLTRSASTLSSQGGLGEVPVNHGDWNPAAAREVPEGHVARLAIPTGRDGITLDLLFVRRSSSTIITSFHGALDRARYQLPRFERLTTLLQYPHSLILVADPTLHLGENFQLGWYTGWDEYDAQSAIARILHDVASAWASERVIHTGSSGGGFAALQLGALMPGTEVIAYNAQTAIHHYLAGGTSYSAQRMFIRCVHPNLFPTTPNDTMLREDWTAFLGDRASVLRRYTSQPSHQTSPITLVQNIDEFHYVDHYLPFIRTMVIPGSAVGGQTNRLSSRVD